MNKLMRAVELQAPGTLRCVGKEIPGLEKSGDVIVKVKACGVCGSDIQRTMVKGAHVMPIVIGHEFAGEVIEVGKGVQSAKPGDRVTVMPLVPCEDCDYCRIGEYTLCDDYLYYGSRIPGAMAEYIRVDAENVLILPENVDYEMGAMTDPVSVALHAVRKASVEPGQTAVVFGLGAIGLITLQWLKAVGCGSIFAVDIFEEKLALARELGADFTINGKNGDAVQDLLAHTQGRGADIAIELAGNKITQVQAIQSVGKMGKVILCGISYDDLLLPNQAVNAILRGELIIKGSWNSSISPLPINEWKSALAFMDNGKIKVKPLISHRVKLEDCQSVFEMMFYQKEVFTKVLFEPEL
ncbi:MAG TPA: galactitol-1-phosphate 5-dehydrogenase [Atribacteraceae bacterium]|nr:galactitol-1-phosphate 5-dehydrogenase [Atribacteraceae bacterium]